MNTKHSPGLADAASPFRRDAALNWRNETVGQRIKRLRRNAGLSQAQVAEIVLGQKTAQPSVSRWEKDDDLPSQAHMHKLANLFGLSEAELHYGAEAESTVAPRSQTVPVVGYVGAGAKIFPVDDFPVGYGLDEVEVPFNVGKPLVAARVRGDSMRPMLHDNWLLIYTRDYEGVPEECINKLCIVKISGDGPTLIKELRRGNRRGRYNLLSTNASPIEDVVLDWAAKVLFIQPA